MMKSRHVHLVCAALTVAGCQSAPRATASPVQAPAPSAAALPGQAFAEATCGGCHAVGRSGHSSVSDAPPFMAIVNQDGLTEETLSTWLRGAHNYPSEMDFYLNDAQVNALVAYMLTLKDPNYRRPPD
jgi:mono/diheme cytochrome c family protein